MHLRADTETVVRLLGALAQVVVIHNCYDSMMSVQYHA